MKLKEIFLITVMTGLTVFLCNGRPPYTGDAAINC